MKQILKDFLLDVVRQILGWPKPRPGKLILTRHTVNKMNEYQLTTDTIRDVFLHGEEDKKGRIIRNYAQYSVGLYYKIDQRTGKYVITTCWKGGE